MNLVQTDMWHYKAEAKCITTNGCVGVGGLLIMGAGIALEARDKFPGLSKVLGGLVEEFGNRVFPLDTSGVVAPGYTLVSFPTKYDWYHAACPKLVRSSAEQLAELITLRGWKSCLLPAPGCKNGKLSWRDVEPILDKVLGGLPVTVVMKP